MAASTMSFALVFFFFAELRAEQLVDLLLDGGAAVIGLVDRARQVDEAVAEILGFLASADVVLDVPQALVDLLELAEQLLKARQTRMF